MARKPIAIPLHGLIVLVALPAGFLDDTGTRPRGREVCRGQMTRRLAKRRPRVLPRNLLLGIRDALWRAILARPRIHACHVRLQSVVDWPPLAENAALLGQRVGVPTWVIERLNPGVKDAKAGDSVWVPAVMRWRTARWCWDPVTAISPAAPPPPPRVEAEDISF